MYVNFGYDLPQLLFSGVNISTVSGIIGASACTILLVLIYELSKILLAYFKFYSSTLRPNKRPDCNTDDILLVENQVPSKTTRYISLFTEVVTYAIQIAFGYTVMLLVMTFNGYLLISVLIASGLSYFLVGQMLMSIQLKTSKLNIPCQHCITHPKNSSITSSTEAISDSVNEEQESGCCLRERGDITTETKY